jgi:hypothetical protein
MKQRPILFSTPMVQSIMAERKSQTRRTSGLEELNKSPNEWTFIGFDGKFFNFQNNKKPTLMMGVPAKFGIPGDVLWVRETTCFVSIDHAHDLLEGAIERTQFVYKTNVHPDWMDYAKNKYGYKWKPSIFMPKDAARIWLHITSVRVERLHSISEQDAIFEGVKKHNKFGYECSLCNQRGHILTESILDLCDDGFYNNAVSSFFSLWQSINGKESLESNPWVWVIEFERIEKPD